MCISPYQISYTQLQWLLLINIRQKGIEKFPLSPHQKLTHISLHQKCHIFQRSIAIHYFWTQKYVASTSQVKGLTMAQAVSCQHFTMETLANPRPVHVGFVMGKVALGQDFLQVLPFYPARIILIIPSEW
jgi:hypothetical protein